MNKNYYHKSDTPASREKEEMWNHINQTLPLQKQLVESFHWRSFWLGNAAAVLLIFACIGVYYTADGFFKPIPDGNTQVYEKLNAAVNQLDEATPVLLQQANMEQRGSMESTLVAIREIDRLIEEVKYEIEINGLSPTSQHSLKRLYATKLDFYKNLLLTNSEQS